MLTIKDSCDSAIPSLFYQYIWNDCFEASSVTVDDGVCDLIETAVAREVSERVTFQVRHNVNDEINSWLLTFNETKAELYVDDGK